MIAVDTSAIIAIVLHEPERAALLAALLNAGAAAISSGTMIETRIVCFRRGGQQLVSEVDKLIDALGIQIMPPGDEEVAAAHRAFLQCGKGNGHPAQLNFGDLFSYALAKARGLPLLFIGDDFAATDIRSAIAG